MKRTTRCAGTLVILVTGILVSAAPKEASGQTSELLDRSFEIANHIELYRSIPASVLVGGETVDAGDFFLLGIDAALRLADPGFEVSNIDWDPPVEWYPEMILDEAVYGHPLSRQEYLAFLQAVLDLHPTDVTLPSTFTLRNGEYRFVDAFYLVSHILRFFRTYGYLPSEVDPKIASPDGLYPWNVPVGKLEFTGAVQNDEDRDYPRQNVFYEESVMDYDMYHLAKEIIGSETDVHTAGQKIYDWVRALYHSTPYGLAADVLEGAGNAYEMIRNMQGTSDTPWRPIAGLFPAAAIPHGYGTFHFGSLPYGGAVYIKGDGWVNAEYHEHFGSNIYANEFLNVPRGGPLPRDEHAIALSPTHPVVDAVKSVIAEDSDTPEVRAFWINPHDVTTVGPETIAEIALAGGFSAVVLTGKTYMGRLYFETGEPGDNFDFDALADLAPVVRGAGLKLLVAINSLSDYDLGRAAIWGQRYYDLPAPSAPPYNEFYISPCIPAYRAYLHRLIDALYGRYEIDGLVLARNYVIFDAWKNAECGIAQNDAAQRTYLAGFVNDLAGYAKSVQPDAAVYFLTAPLVEPNGNQVDDLTDDALASLLLPDNVDGIILGIFGLSWLTDHESYPLRSLEGLDRFISEYAQRTSIPLSTIVFLSKEWEYPPEFYRGLARRFRERGLDGVFLFSRSSFEGELGPAFTAQHYAKLERIRFQDPPPEMKGIPMGVDSRLEKPHAAIPLLQQNFPNPFGRETTIGYELRSAGPVALSVFNMLGQNVATLIDRVESAGSHAVTWDGTDDAGEDVAAGIYFVRLATAYARQSRKLVVVR